MSASKGRGMAEKTMASTIRARRTMPNTRLTSTSLPVSGALVKTAGQAAQDSFAFQHCQ